MRRIKTTCGLRLAAGHAFVQNPRRGDYAIAADQPGIHSTRFGRLSDKVIAAVLHVSEARKPWKTEVEHTV